MSSTRVLIAVVLALILMGVAFVVLRRPAGAIETPGPVLRFDQAHANGITISRPDGRTEIVKRSSIPGEWVIELRANGTSSEWPATASNVRAAFQILSNIAATRPGDAKTELPADATLVTITSDSGPAASMKIDGHALAGNVLAAPESPRKGPPVWIDASFGDMLVKAGPREWRDPRVFPAIGETSRITLVSGSTTIALARLQGRWSLRQPIQEAAEPEAITKLSGYLATVEIRDFLDSGPSPTAQTGLDSPVASITLETDQRDPNTGAARVLKATLSIGQPSDISGKGVFASISLPGLSERTVVVSAEPIAALSRDPASYIARRAVAGAAADVGSIVVGKRSYSRTIDGWRSTSSSPGDQSLPLTSADAASLEAFLKLLMNTPADRVAIDSTVDEHAVAVEIKSIGDAPMASVAVSNEADPSSRRPSVVIRSNGVARRYTTGDAVAAWPWVAGE